MKINTIYNSIVLFYLHAFCLLLCFQIEDCYDVKLQMGLWVFSHTSAYWDLLLEMLYLSPFILYYFFKKQEDTESNNFDQIFRLILSISLLCIVIAQLTNCWSNILYSDLPLKPGLLCIGVNILALALYYLWIYTQQKFPTTEKVKLIRICTIACVLIQLIYGFVITKTYAPFERMRLLDNEQSLCWCVNKIQSFNCDRVNSIDYIIDKIPDKKHKKNIKQFIKDKRLIYEKINDNKYKISWKQYLSKEEKDRITRNKIYIDNEFYDKNEKIIEIKKENEKNKKNTKTIKQNSNTKPKIKLNKEEAEAMKKLLNTVDKNHRKTIEPMLEQFDLENIEIKDDKKITLKLSNEELKALSKFFDKLSDNNKKEFKKLMEQTQLII